mmetsp:Transcript_6324/g.19089  ORF Transcript_6324/g.19089 Transcript_6324/m.19089 type:complete len:83 (+) Transcript_6324:62-310(+)
MRPEVRELYRAMILACRRYPEDFSRSRERVKAAFRKNADVSSEDELQKCIDRGYYVVGEIEGMSALHKYRTMKKRYGATDKE